MLAIGESRTISVEWHTLVPSLLKSGTHILDLGANIGQFCARSSRSSTVIAMRSNRSPNLGHTSPNTPA